MGIMCIRIRRAFVCVYPYKVPHFNVLPHTPHKILLPRSRNGPAESFCLPRVQK
ncbi:hypothetical protein AG1IA_00321 [Rhizoctonia solani AG-1 IA]|uniref:Uncharacterized protein n=1 Tax=Thanatephorus cucumeris (strain AG1-IA) TaxID=983506 RepID=L8XAE3_THACA|nr:hypothetical protein AG1IA_00321 [Rhizoctonia solani AG-1 IA]